MSNFLKSKKILIPLLLIIIFYILTSGIPVFPPYGFVANRFSRDQIRLKAVENQKQIQNMFSALNFDDNNFKVIGNSYSDGCFIGGGYDYKVSEPYHKGCFGKAVLFVGSKEPADLTVQRVRAILSGTDISALDPYMNLRGNEPGCFGPSITGISEAYNVNESGYNSNSMFHIFDVNADCDGFTIAQKHSLKDPPIFTLSKINYSDLTKTFNETAIINHLITEDYKSLIKISFEKVYFHKTIPVSYRLFPVSTK